VALASLALLARPCDLAVCATYALNFDVERSNRRSTREAAILWNTFYVLLPWGICRPLRRVRVLPCRLPFAPSTHKLEDIYQRSEERKAGHRKGQDTAGRSGHEHAARC
jgi:hypothetical protein